MIEGIILGVIQGITEWLPVSSSGVLTLIGLKFFDGDLSSSVSMAIFLHVGTFLSALVYFWKDVASVLKRRDKKVFNFLFVSTVVTGIVGIPIIFLLYKTFSDVAVGTIIFLIGLFLVVTGFVQLKKPNGNLRVKSDLKNIDALVAGALQGVAVLPGFSRSGLTVASLLFRKIQETDALKLSFLMSLPAVLGGNIILNILDDGVVFNISSLVALLTAFIVGLLTIDILIKVSRKINFGLFVIGFGVLTIISVIFI